MYLLDTNIFLELLLDQESANEVERFLQSVPRERLHISEFSLYSVGIILFRRKLFDVFIQFVDDLIITGAVRLLRLPIEDATMLTKVALKFGLDFDDAYQYAIAERYGLTIVSFDSDFSQTEKGYKTPGDLLQ